MGFAWAINVLHLDLARVKAGQLVELTIAVELRGEAPGTNKGGVVSHIGSRSRHSLHARGYS